MKINLFTNPYIKKQISQFKFHNVASTKPYSTLYEIRDSMDKKIGSFAFFDNGYIESLQIDEKIRGTKKSVAALLAIKDFIIEKAKIMKLDFVEFVALKDNKYHVAKTYQKLGATNIYNESERYTFFTIPVCKEMKNHFSMQKFNVNNLKKIVEENSKSF